MGIQTNILVNAQNNVNNLPAEQFNGTVRELNDALTSDGAFPGNTLTFSNNATTGTQNETQSTLGLFTAIRASAFTVSGASNSYTITTNQSLVKAPLRVGSGQTYPSGLTLNVSFPVTNTGAVIVNVDGIGVKNLVASDGSALTGGELNSHQSIKFDGVQWRLLEKTKLSQFTNDAGYITLQAPTTPYSVNSAKTDSNGYANFITKIDNSTVGFDTNSSSTPIRITYPDGTQETNNTLPNITGISTDATFFVIEEKNSNPYITALQPLESYSAPASPATGQLWLDISTMPYIPKKWNGSSWIVTQFVKLGEFTRSGGIIGTPISYALNGRFISQEITIPSRGTSIFASHNLGISNGLLLNVKVALICKIAEASYIPGDITTQFSEVAEDTDDPLYAGDSYYIFDRNTVGHSISPYGTYVFDKNTGARVNYNFTNNNWRYLFVVKRSF